MIWLNSDVGTSAFNEVAGNLPDINICIVDVRDLVDKAGNDVEYINLKISESLALLQQGKKIIICCDYGMSRSNSIGIGVLVKWLNISFDDAISMAKKVVDESGIKIEMLNTVYSALYDDEKGLNTGKLKIESICITGANGFLGRNLVMALGNQYRLSLPGSKEIDLIENIVGLDLLVKRKEVDCIIHLANPKIFTNTKSIGDTLVMLKNVLDVCRTNKVKLIYLSGWEIYSGYRSTNLVADEGLHSNPKGTYGETKWLCEILIRQYSIMYGIDYQIIRSGPVYGPGAEKPKFIYNFIDKALKGERITTHRYLNGSPSMDLLYVDDLVSFLVKCIRSYQSGEVNVGSGTSVSTPEVAAAICELTGSSSVIDQVQINDYSSNIIMDNRRAKNLFAWTPGVMFKEGIAIILENYKA